MRYSLLAVALLLAACAETPADNKPVQTAAAEHHVCLSPTWIENTVILDDNTILFKMKGGKIWKNTLQDRCFGLWIEGGFAYEVRGDAVCGNEQVIHVLRTHSVCMLGEFTPYVEPPKESSSAK
jgi:hypothetical protein